jgi:hypothetical protein
MQNILYVASPVMEFLDFINITRVSNNGSGWVRDIVQWLSACPVYISMLHPLHGKKKKRHWPRCS